jgi:hypothetical protein
VDHRPVGTGKVGKTTIELQKLLGNVMLGRNPKYRDWYYMVSPKVLTA